MIMTSDVKKFMQSKEAEEARSILNSADLDDINLTAEQFVKARDYVILESLFVTDKGRELFWE